MLSVRFRIHSIDVSRVANVFRPAVLGCWGAATSLILFASGASSAPIDFQKQIRPILAEHCFQCHGPDNDAREAGLRLDLRDVATSKLDSGSVAIAPGNPSESELIQRITSGDSDMLMPPPSIKKPLNPDQKKTLEAWIAEGAKYSSHWAFEAPERPAVPKVSAGAFSVSYVNPIDAFVADRLAREKMAMSPPAQPEILCRRIYLDLIGLPPSPKEVDDFAVAARANRAAAVEQLIARLFKSPHYGEKWARHWLDAARYADSNGYEKDLPRQQWAWRDWVIDAYNRDMPYDKFIIEQIAGDLLDRPAQLARASLGKHASTVATGFLRNGMINEEGAIVPEEFRMESMYDRIDCVGKAVLGLSLQCGQCHTHKFDPLEQTEYYGLFAFLNNTYEAESWVYNQEQLDKIAAVKASVADAENKIRAQLSDWKAQLSTWEAEELARQNAVDWKVVEAIDLHSTSELNHPVAQPDKSILTLGHKTISGDVYMIAAPNLKGVTGIRTEILTHGDLPFGGPGRSFRGTWALTELIVESQKPGETKWEKLKLVNATADFAEPEHKMEPEWSNASADKDNKRICGPVAFMIDGKDETAWRADRGAGLRNTDSVAAAQFEKPLDVPEGTKIKISLRTNHGGDDNGPKNTMIGRFRISLTTTPDPKVNATSYAAVLALRAPAAERSSQQQADIFDAWHRSVAELKPINDQIDAARKQFPEALTSVMHLAERDLANERATHRLDRGSWTKPMEAIKPHVPAALHPIKIAGESAGGKGTPTRLDFARWLVDRRSPLTARVAVNRVWQVMFGSGLVETSEDFGTRAPIPEHQLLLDWLAVEFMDQGWCQQKLLGTIIGSAAYQQSSTVTPALLERDPKNRLLARGPRFRVEAEVVRDLALSVSGLLNPRVGGPSIYPPVPQNVLDFNFFKPMWPVAEGPERYRRALYVFRKRSMPDPVLTTFDAPNADIACARRPRSNTPLAALVSLNETVFVEAARALALRILQEGGATDAERIDYAFRLCTSRHPSGAERDATLAMLAEHRARIADGWLSAREITTGDPVKLPDLPPKTTPQDAAAWTIVGRVLLNLDETLTKN